MFTFSYITHFGDGIQVCPVPTAILSSHTGGFGEVVLRDLTDYIAPALEHYKRLSEDFDCIYSGFLASIGQIDHCLEFFASYPNALKVVDPVMGDHGKAYKTCTKELCSRMSELVAIADIITPNTTEAAMLLGEKPAEFGFSTQQIKSWLVRLSEKGLKIIVITSVDLAGGNKCNVGYDKQHSTFWKVPYTYVPVNYPGTGDVFSSNGGVHSKRRQPSDRNEPRIQLLELAIKTNLQLFYRAKERDYAGGLLELAHSKSHPQRVRNTLMIYK